MEMLKIHNNPPRREWPALTARCTRQEGEITERVAAILSQVRTGGDKALRDLVARIEGYVPERFEVSRRQRTEAAKAVPQRLKTALAIAKSNIEAFHRAQLPPQVDIEVMPGVRCVQRAVAIGRVGLYVPGGSAPLFSTVLMLAVPAAIAGCTEIVLCTPAGRDGSIAPEIRYAAALCGVRRVFALGGAQAVAAMAYGTESVPRVDKIFGPGNAYVTEAKRQVSRRPDGAAIDMPAGPSEVLVIADAEADPRFVAADLLSQAEHGPDSQVVLLTPSKTLAKAVAQAAAKELETLPRRAIAEKSLSASRLIVVKDLKECVEVSNRYAPEHLILQTRNARELVPSVQNAGSVFVGDWSPESGGDYATGTNHVLPTYGCAAAYSSLGLADFTKRMTVQEMTPQGFSELGEAIAILAHAEQLDAHRNAVLVRLEKLSKKIGG